MLRGFGILRAVGVAGLGARVDMGVARGDDVAGAALEQIGRGLQSGDSTADKGGEVSDLTRETRSIRMQNVRRLRG